DLHEVTTHLGGQCLIEKAMLLQELRRKAPKARIEARERRSNSGLELVDGDTSNRIAPTLDGPREKAPRELRMTRLVFGYLREYRLEFGILRYIRACLGVHSRQCLAYATLLHGGSRCRSEVARQLDPGHVERTWTQRFPSEAGDDNKARNRM